MRLQVSLPKHTRQASAPRLIPSRVDLDQQQPLPQRAIDYKIVKRTYLTSARRSLPVRLDKLAIFQSISPAFLPRAYSSNSSSPPSPREPQPRPHNNNLDINQTHLLKLIWPLGPVRTVIPEVPVEPAVLGAGLGLEAAAEAESE